MKEQDKIKTKQDVIDFINCYIQYRGGMWNRIDALDILEHLEGKRRRHYKNVLKFSKEQSLKELGK